MTTKFSTIDDMWINFKNTLLEMAWKNSYHPHYQDQNLHIHGSPTVVRRSINRKNKAGNKAWKTNNEKYRDRYRKHKVIAQKQLYI